MKVKLLRRAESIVLALAMLISMFAVTAVTANAASGDILNVNVAEVTKKYSEIGSLLVMINQKRAEAGLGTLTMDQPLMNDAIVRAVELPMLYSTRNLLDVDFNDRFMLKDSYADNTYHEIVLSVSGELSKVASALMEQEEYTSAIFDPDITEIGIGVVTMRGEKTRYICVRTTNEKSMAGKNPTIVANSFYTQTESEETVTVQGYVTNFKFSSDYDNNDHKIVIGESEQIWLKAYELNGKSTYAKVKPASVTTSDWDVFTTQTGGILTAVSEGTADITIRVAGEDYRSYTKTVKMSAVVSIIGDFFADPIPDQPYTGSYIEPDVTVRNSKGEKLEKDVDYELDYSKNRNVGTATVDIYGIGDYDGKTAVVNFKIRKMTDPLIITVTADKYEALAGSEINVTATVKSGKAPSEFVFYSIKDKVSEEFDRNETGTAVFVPSEGGEYQIKVIAVNDDYTVNDSINVTVYEALTASVTLSDEEVLNGREFTATVTAKNGTEPYSYTYKMNGLSVAFNSSNTYTYKASGSGTATVEVVVTDKNQNTATASAQITVVDYPTCGFTFTPAEPEKGSTVTVAASSSGGFDPKTFTGVWSVDGEEQGTITFDSENKGQFTADKFGKYSVTVICKDSKDNEVSETKEFVISEPLSVSLGISKDKIKTGDVATLTATAAGGTAPYTYKFTNYDGTMLYNGSDNNCVFNADAAGTKTVSVTVTDKNGLTAVCELPVDITESLSVKAALTSMDAYVGDNNEILYDLTGGFAPVTLTMSYTHGQQTTAIEPDVNGKYFFNSGAAGQYSIEIKAVDAEGYEAFSYINYNVFNKVVNTSEISNTKVVRGKTLTVSGNSTGGLGTVSYSYYYKKIDSGAWTYCGTGKVKEFSFAAATSYKIKVVAADTSMSSDTKIFTILVKEPKDFINNSTIDSNVVYMDEGTTINTSISGGVAPYSFSYYYKKASSQTWTKFGSDSASGGVFNPAMTGEYQLRSVAVDVNGTRAEKIFDITVKKASAFRNTSTTKFDTVQRNSAIEIHGSAKGGKGPYTYEFYYKKSYKVHWKTIAASTEDPAVAYVVPNVTTSYDIKVIAKDSTGAVDEKIITVYVERFITEFTNVSTISTDEIEWGESVVVNAEAACADTPYTTEYYYKKTGSPVWQKAEDATNQSIFEFKPIFRSPYEIKVVMTDANGRVSTVQFHVDVE